VRRQHPQLPAEDGFTLVEVLIAALILILGTIALVTSLSVSRGLTTSAQAHQAAAAVAAQELERVEAQTWANIALISAPTKNSGATATDPTYYLQTPSATCAGQGPSSQTNNCYQWNWSNSSSTLFEPLVIGGADATANPWTFTTLGASGGTQFTFTVYRFITWINDPNCTVSTCSGSSDDKRILIAVTGTDLNKPVTVLTTIGNPVGGSQNPVSGATCTDNTSAVPCFDH